VGLKVKSKRRLMHFLGTVVAQYPTAAFFVLVLHGIAVVADILAAFFTGHACCFRHDV
jgi:hypothetical protein